jgi:ABC-type nitrate/sulfonate/bicarbonate transport system substrate-binding protein
MAKLRIQPHVRLHEWVAEEKGFFRDEGLDYEFDAQGSPAPRSRLRR